MLLSFDLVLDISRDKVAIPGGLFANLSGLVRLFVDVVVNIKQTQI